MRITEWHTWVTLWVTWVIGAVTGTGMYAAAIWASNSKFALTGVLLTILCVISSIPLSIWTADNKPYRPDPVQRLPRAQRRQLAKERADILLRKEIEKLEIQELGHTR